jgi:hypothetical protein
MYSSIQLQLYMLMSFCGFFFFHQGYTKDNNKENRSTSTTISSPRSTLRRQAKANNNLLLPRCVCVCFSFVWLSISLYILRDFADCFSHFDVSFFLGMHFPLPIWYVDFTTQRDDPSAKNSWMPPC